MSFSQYRRVIERDLRKAKKLGLQGWAVTHVEDRIRFACHKQKEAALNRCPDDSAWRPGLYIHACHILWECEAVLGWYLRDHDWTAWAGGRRPVAADTKVHACFRDGTATTTLGSGTSVVAGLYAWSKRSNARPDGIVGYRVAKG